MKNMKHYYGNLVRIIFVLGAVWMMIGLPTMTRILNLPVGLPIIAIIILVISGGFTNPAQKFSLVLNTVISTLFTAVFAYLAYYLYVHPTGSGFLFANQVAAIVFLAATYFSVKSWRGAVTNEIPE